jgi:4,5-dihydroxyphthalate decarboxylase
MAERKLKTAIQTQGHTRALKDGSVKPTSFAFEFEEVPAIIQAFRRMVRGLEFDISEMAITTYICAKEHGKRFTALPIFVVRAFHHGAIVINTKLGIRSPKDLEGKQVGVNRGYTVTTGVWARGILQHEHGVDLNKITWVLSGDEHVAQYRPPANVVPIAAGKKIEEMVIAGELAGAIGVDINHPDVKPLIPDVAAAAALLRLNYD